MKWGRTDFRGSKMNKIFSLENKTVVITGACGLLGRQHSEAISSMGGNPVLLDLASANPEELAKKISAKYGVSSIGYSIDITDEQSLEECASAVVKKFKKIDALINNAANNPKVTDSLESATFSRLENFSMQAWSDDLAVGLTGAFLCAKYFGPVIAANENGGSIINISSDLGIIAPDQRLYRNPLLPNHLQPVKPVTYSVVKSGLLGLTRYLSTYWPDKVRCNALCPGGVEQAQSDEFIKDLSSRIPMGRMAKATEYQGAIIFLLSDASSYMNGAVIPIDGGRSAW